VPFTRCLWGFTCPPEADYEGGCGTEGESPYVTRAACVPLPPLELEIPGLGTGELLRDSVPDHRK
jgi:hypothetical protein